MVIVLIVPKHIWEKVYYARRAPPPRSLLRKKKSQVVVIRKKMKVGLGSSTKISWRWGYSTYSLTI
jgi:hypothetical protein